MKKFDFKIDYGAFYKSMIPMLLPIGFIYLVLLLLPLLQFFNVILDGFIGLLSAIQMPREYMSAILMIFLGVFVVLTLLFFILGVPLIIASAFRLVCCPMSVNMKGLEATCGPTIWSNYHNLEWGEIKTVSLVRAFGLPYAKVTSEVRPDLWLPLFYDKKDLMPEVFSTLAPKGNPIRLFFEDPSHLDVFDRR